MAISGSSGGGGSGAIRAGRAFVEMSMRDLGIRKGLDNIQRRMSSAAATFGRIGGGLLGAGTALTAPLAAIFKSGLDRAGQLEDLTDAFGLSAEGASKMAYAFEVAGGSIEDLEGVMKQLASKNTSGKPLDEFLLDVTDQLNAIENPSQRAAKAFELMGKKGLPFLKVSRDIRRLMGEAPLISQETMNNAEQFNQELSKIGMVAGASLLPLLQFLAPLAKMFADLARENAHLLRPVAAVGAALTALGITFLGIGGTLALASQAIGVVVAAVGFLVSPVGLAVAAVAALAAGFIYLTGLGQTLGDTFNGVSDALALGDLEAAWAIGIAGLELEWVRLVEKLTAVWGEFKDFFVDGWHSAIYLVKRELNDWQTWTAKLIVKMVASLQDLIGRDTLATLGLDLLGGANPAEVIDNLERMRDQDQGRIDRQFQQEQAAREAARRGDNEESQRERRLAEMRLKNLQLGVAIRQSLRAGGPAAAPPGPSPGLASSIAGGSRGAFVGFGSLASVFGSGAGSVQQKQLKQLEKIAETTAEEKEVMEEVARQLGKQHGGLWVF